MRAYGSVTLRSMADPAKIEGVLRRMEEGESENAACKAEGIHRATFRSAALRYRADEAYARALEAIARDQVETLERTMQELRAGDIAPDVARIEADTRKWIAQRLFRPLWGDKSAVEHSGSVDVNLHSWLIAAKKEAGEG